MINVTTIDASGRAVTSEYPFEDACSLMVQYARQPEVDAPLTAELGTELIPEELRPKVYTALLKLTGRKRGTALEELACVTDADTVRIDIRLRKVDARLVEDGVVFERIQTARSGPAQARSPSTSTCDSSSDRTRNRPRKGAVSLSKTNR